MSGRHAGDAASVVFLLGMDSLVASDLRVGGLLGYSSGEFELKEDVVSAVGHKSAYLGLYGAKEMGNLSLSVDWILSGHNVGTSRTVSFGDTDQEELSADHVAFSSQIVGELSYRVLNDVGTSVSPFIRVGGSSFVGAAFSEDGVNALSVSKTRFNSLVVTLGLKGVSCIKDCTMPSASGFYYMAGFRKTLLPMDVSSVSVKFRDIEHSAYSVPGIRSRYGSLVLGFGLDFGTLDNLSLSIGYHGLFSEILRVGGIKVDLRWSF